MNNDYSYIAGFVDGEGTIGLKCQRRTGKRKGQIRIEPYLNIVNTSFETLAWIQEVFAKDFINAGIYERKMPKKYKKLFNLYITGYVNLEKTFDLLYPYLKIKKGAASVVKEFILLRKQKRAKDYFAPIANEERILYNRLIQYKPHLDLSY